MEVPRSKDPSFALSVASDIPHRKQRDAESRSNADNRTANEGDMKKLTYSTVTITLVALMHFKKSSKQWGNASCSLL